MYYHLSTNHLSNGLIFRDDDDKLIFLNRMALSAITDDVAIYAYCLMDNHIHILLGGTPSSIKDFFTDLKRDYAQYGSYKYGKGFSLGGFAPDLKEIGKPEYFRSVVAYILRNPFVAGMAGAFNYKWSSAGIYFNSHLASSFEVPLKQYGLLKFKRVIKTRRGIPEGILMYGDMISPWRWCNYKKVEEMFGTSVDLFKAVSRWNTEKEVESFLLGKEINQYTDETLSKVVTDFCKPFGVLLPKELDSISFRRLIGKLSGQYGASHKQIARLTGADDETILRFSQQR